MHHVLGVSGSYPVLIALWLLPLAGGVICWTFGPQLRGMAGWFASALVGASFVLAVLSWPVGTQNVAGALGAHQPLGSWMPGFDFGLLLDPLSLIWTFIITGVGFLIVFYSIGYMDGDVAFARFFAYMSFFVFAMLTLVLSDNFVGLLVGWGLVGLASYFLIGFWFERPSAVAAARKAFVINVVGDVGMMFAIFVIVANVHTIGFGDVFASGGTLSAGVLFVICLALTIGAAAKSAQVPLHTWLPDAMEGPTPVSALIHAATMVTAGVYLVARCAPLWNHSAGAQLLVGTVGGVTALLGAILGTAQWDMKRILAYSTMSQIGYMIMGVGVGAYDAGVAHFFTHAFFKAQLFLGAGLAIHALSNEQDIRRMGGLWKRMPFTFWVMLTAVLSISGVPGFSGFFSKDAVIYGALQHGHPWLYAVGIVTAGITAYYMFRLLFVAFLGEYRGEVDPDAHHGNAPAWIMNAPVAILVAPSVAIGAALMFGGENAPWARFFAPLFGPQTAPVVAGAAPAISEGLTSTIVFVMVLVGFAIAWQRYATRSAQANAVERLDSESVRMPAVLTNLFYFDAAIDLIFVRPAQLLGALFGRVLDPRVFDGAVRDLVFWAGWFGAVVRSLQTGLVRAYALILAFGAACFIVYYAFAGGMR
ncbi:MAG TPA: NADH-quinone oxidoreductase subunit L [Candidatus Cybelea sp.]|jgi:NADH-quinone oxidoreductase subunit L|nr:NADH-quinone oxidoreductase subunit L [Candidatus Cybelea sp.]